MKSNRIVIISLIVIIVLSLGLAFLKEDKQAKYDWNVNYIDSKKNPYEIGVAKDLLKQKAKNFEVIDEVSFGKVLKNKPFAKSSYVSIGMNSFLNTKDIADLMDYMSRGNDAIIITENFSSKLLNELSSVGNSIERIYLTNDKVKISLNFKDVIKDSFDFEYKNKNKISFMDWPIIYRYHNSDAPDEGNAGEKYEIKDNTGGYESVELGTVNGALNFIVFQIGKGRLFLHSNPILFTNHTLLTENGQKYFNNVFRNIPLENVYYDIRSRNYSNEFESKNEEGKFLSYVLSQQSLRAAWYLLLFILVLFFLFKAKRKQNIIPVIEKKKNSSLQFIRTLGELFFRRTNNKEMAKIAMGGLLFFIRNKLNVSTRNIDETRIELIALRSGNNVGNVKDLIQTGLKYTNEEKTHVSSAELLELERLINNFYKSYKNKQ